MAKSSKISMAALLAKIEEKWERGRESRWRKDNLAQKRYKKALKDREDWETPEDIKECELAEWNDPEFLDTESFDVADQLASCCGIIELQALDDADPLSQVASMADALNVNSKEQLLFTDVVGRGQLERSTWGWTKVRAHQGPVSLNPSTRNKVQVYIVTADDIRAMAKELGV